MNRVKHQWTLTLSSCCQRIGETHTWHFEDTKKKFELYSFQKKNLKEKKNWVIFSLSKGFSIVTTMTLAWRLEGFGNQMRNEITLKWNVRCATNKKMIFNLNLKWELLLLTSNFSWEGCGKFLILFRFDYRQSIHFEILFTFCTPLKSN